MSYLTMKAAGILRDFKPVEEIRCDRDTLTRMQCDHRACRQCHPVSVAAYDDVGVHQLAVRSSVVEAQIEGVASPVDDVFGLEDMIVHRELLPRVHHQELLCVLFRILVTAQLVAVADRKQNEAFLVEPAKSAVGHVPPQHVVPDLIVVMAFGLPVLRCPVSERWKTEALL